MTAVLTPDRARRRFVGLTALRWLPVGIVVPVSVLLATARGLSPAEIGLCVAVYGAVTLVLELPTGGFADALGHRTVLASAGLVTAAGLLTMAVADSVPAFAIAWALQGVARALDSGPLEAWYVDAARAGDPAADVTRGLAQAGAADGAGLAVGAVLGGTLPLLLDHGGAAALAAPLVLAAVFAVVHVTAVLLLVVPPHRSGAAGRGALLAGVREVPVVVTATVHLVLRDRLLRLLLGVSFLVGVVLTSLELLGPLHFAELAGSAERGSAVFGVVTAVSFAAAALGALLAPVLGRATGGSVVVVSAGTSVLAAGAVAVVAGAPGVVPAAVAYAAFYLLNGAAWPSRKQVMHDRTTSAQRSTTVSASSLALMLGGMLGSLTIPRLADGAGLPTGLLAGAGGMLLLALLSLGLRGGPDARAPGRDAPAGGESRHGPGPGDDQPAALPGGLRERARAGARVHGRAR
ncbi:Predicted arabinose efflux permease, MFS family [Blastococcus aggregatus]|uniref:Predicted arabinose efflux permease, MFS family n=1 Tax=Blastococcus aggregatus TaxID=38502 RepID=A0A285UX07_9ACTN|nr:MFS transporter [Blastococcus aggregatus]SOC46455.1 Predicted arabinose efflux permease, MFS family [Blastococcus aggregatus]